MIVMLRLKQEKLEPRLNRKLMVNKHIMLIAAITLIGESCVSQLSGRTEREHMNQMAAILNGAVEKRYVDIYYKDEFHIKNQVPVNFFIYDLVDTVNNSYLPNIKVDREVRLRAEGVYHFAPWDLTVSFSHIAVIKGKEIKVFRLLNCDGKGDNIDEVLKYLENNFNYAPPVLKRVAKYRQHGVYAATDDMSYVDCELVKE